MEDGSKEFNLEAEIALLNEKIESKKKELEASRGISPEVKEVVREVVTEHVYPSGPKPTSTASSSSVSKSYLDDLDEESTKVVNDLIELIPSVGVEKAIAQAKKNAPFVLDAFHDALVDKLYEELKAHGHIK